MDNYNDWLAAQGIATQDAEGGEGGFLSNAPPPSPTTPDDERNDQLLMSPKSVEKAVQELRKRQEVTAQRRKTSQLWQHAVLYDK